MQLDRAIGLRPVRDRKRPATAAIQQHIEILTRQPVQSRLAFHGLQMQADHIGCELPFARHAHIELPARHIFDRSDFACRHNKVGQRNGLAQQNGVTRTIMHIQRGGRIARIVAATLDQGGLAAATHTGATGIRQRDTRALRRFQHGFAGQYVETAAGIGEGNGMHVEVT
jgi:hypothetical protein